MQLLTDVDGDEVSLVRRAANRRRFLLLKGDEQLSGELSDILEVPWEREGALLDEIRKDGVSNETVEKAVVAAVRLLKGVEGEFSPELIEKLGDELYGISNPKLNTSRGSGNGGKLFGSGDGDKYPGSGSGEDIRTGSGRDGELTGKATPAPKVADDDSDEKEPDADEDDDKKGFPFKRKAKKAKKSVGKSADMDDVEELDNDERGTVEVQVPVRKEDGTWDLSGVPVESRPFFEEMISKADRTESDLKEAREQLAKADDTIKHRTMLEKAASYSHVAPTDELAPILKEAADGLSPESFEKLQELLSGAEEKIVKGDLFAEKGAASVSDGSTPGDAWSKIEKAAGELVEKSEGLSQGQAIDRVLKTAEGAKLYAEYLAETGMGVS